MQNFVDRWVSPRQRNGFQVVYLGFLDRSCYIPFKQILNYPHDADWILFGTLYSTENLEALGIEHVMPGSEARNCEH
jgi:hypothetical protein